MSRLPAAVLFALGLGTLVGCHIPANDHCANNEGNTYCVQMEAGLYCDACKEDNYGCVASEADITAPQDDCYAPGDGTTGSDDGDTDSDDGSTDDGGTGSTGDGADDGSTDSTDGTSGTDGTGGTTDTGTTGTGESTDTTGGSTTTGGCDAADGEPDVDDCTDPAAPFCVGGECKDCSESATPDTSCAALGAGTDHCDTDTGECHACVTHAHCTDPSNARCDDASHTCVPCQATPECAGITDHEVCNEGDCVECTPTEDSACAGKLCHALDFECTNFDPGSAGLCETCIADGHCGTGQLCIFMTFEATDVGHFCLYRRDAPAPPNGDCTTVRPYADDTSGTSIEGVATDVCSLRVTTCPAVNDYSQQDCSAPGTGDGECGVVGMDDGYCRNFSGNTDLCTIPCLSDFDCPSPQACDTGDSPWVCEL